MNRYDDLERLFVTHTALKFAKGRIELLIEASQLCREPSCLALIGESRTGKSRLLKFIANKYSKSRDAKGAIVPVLLIAAPSKPSVKSLCETLLKELGDPAWQNRDSETVKTERLRILLKAVRTIVLCIDEFQHFYDKASDKVQHHVSDWLKVLVDDVGIGLIVAGLPSSMQVIDQNEQLRGRFTGVFTMPRFRWEDLKLRQEFIGILEALQQGLKLYDLPDLASDQMAFRFYCASGGLIGYVSKILKEASWIAISSQSNVITMEDLAQAYEQAIWKDRLSTKLNPFDRRFDPTPTSELLDKAARVGEATFTQHIAISNTGKRSNSPKNVFR